MAACVLLDGNVLIAILVFRHRHHEGAIRWFGALSLPFATCSITEGFLVREVMRNGDDFGTAIDLLRGIARHPRHQFWSDEIRYVDVPKTGVRGHKQVTDAYLAQLARHRGGRLATLDRGLAQLHDDVAELVPA